MGDAVIDVVFICPPCWWPEPMPEGHILLLLKRIRVYRTKETARRWHIYISEWMERNGYHVIYSASEMTISMKRKGSDCIIHGLFVDNMMRVPTCDELRDEYMAKCKKDFDITGGGLMEIFLVVEIKQLEQTI
jgi:hypothetical protein